METLTGLFHKKKQAGGHEISKGMEEKSCGNYKGYLKRSAISRDNQENMRNFHWSWVLAMEHPKGEIQFCGISKGEVTSLNIPGFFQKYMFSINHSSLDFFLVKNIQTISFWYNEYTLNSSITSKPRCFHTVSLHLLRCLWLQ